VNRKNQGAFPLSTVLEAAEEVAQEAKVLRLPPSRPQLPNR
jgi:hypothetical protein